MELAAGHGAPGGPAAAASRAGGWVLTQVGLGMYYLWWWYPYSTLPYPAVSVYLRQTWRGAVAHAFPARLQ